MSTYDTGVADGSIDWNNTRVNQYTIITGCNVIITKLKKKFIIIAMIRATRSLRSQPSLWRQILYDSKGYCVFLENSLMMIKGLVTIIQKIEKGAWKSKDVNVLFCCFFHLIKDAQTFVVFVSSVWFNRNSNQIWLILSGYFCHASMAGSNGMRKKNTPR